MASSKKTIEQSIKGIISGWENEAPNASFGGMTLAQYREKVKPTADTRIELSRLDTLTKKVISDRMDADKISNEVNQLVVNGVKGDPTYGADSTLYEAMGYVRKSERKSGLKKPKNTPPAPPK